MENLSKSGFYADLAAGVAGEVKAGTYDRAILCCGTGIGVCIAANKVPGIRAALTHDTYSAGKAATSNNAQIITMGARVSSGRSWPNRSWIPGSPLRLTPRAPLPAMLRPSTSWIRRGHENFCRLLLLRSGTDSAMLPENSSGGQRKRVPFGI